MKTTELYIEQVLIGTLIILTLALPWYVELFPRINALGPANTIAVGSATISLAFWIGIPFDRLADTLSERLEKHNRLQFAIDRSVLRPLPEPRSGKKLSRDVYPENHLLIAGFQQSQAVVNRLEYHRSRIRLTRALAVYCPALTFAAVVGLGRSNVFSNATYSLPIGPVNALAIIGIAYLAWPAFASPPTWLRKIVEVLVGRTGIFGKKILTRLFSQELPRTDSVEFLTYVKDWRRKGGKRFTKKRQYSLVKVWFEEWRILIFPLFLLLGALWIGYVIGPYILLLAILGTVVTLISAWSWWRISTTFRDNLFLFKDKLIDS